MDELNYQNWTKFKREFENCQIELMDIEDQFKEKLYQLKLAEMKLHRKMFEHLIKKTHHMMKNICGGEMDFDFCPNYTAERTNIEGDVGYSLSYYSSGILLNKKNIETTQSVDFMAFWITKAENWDVDDELWWDCEIELSQFKPYYYIDDKNEKYKIRPEGFGAGINLNESEPAHHENISRIINPNQNIWKKLYIDRKRNSVIEDIAFRLIVEDKGDEGDKELEGSLKILYDKYKSEKFDKYSYGIKITYEK